MDSTTTVFSGKGNFRDLGGIVTADGRRVKKGLLFRSGELSRLTSEEILSMKNLHIRMIIDFRSGDEKKGPPKVFQNAEYITLPVENGAFTRKKIMNKLLFGQRRALETMLIEANRAFVTDYTHEFSAFLKHLEKGMPVVFHCTAGKDRTGFAAMLVLAALGVAENIIMEDYLLSNKMLAETIEQTIAYTNEQGLNGALLRPILTARQEYLEAAMEVIESRHGGMENYLTNVLGANVDQLQHLYLEGP